MFYMDKSKELDITLLSTLMYKFRTSELPKLQTWGDYYNGKQKILTKAYTDETKVCNHLITNYCKTIVDTFAGYIAGKPVTYVSDSDINDVQDVINYNDDNQQCIEWVTNALIFGCGYELQWLDEFSQIRYGQISPLSAFPVYSNTMDCELLYFVRWYLEDNFSENSRYIVEVYDKDKVRIYHMQGMGGALELVEEKAHFFKDVPVSVFWMNNHHDNIFSQIMSLQDAYNDLQSGEIDAFSEWCDSYLALTNVDADKDDIAAMKEMRTLVLPEGATAQFITKAITDTQIENMLTNIKQNIFKITSCVDMTDETFLAQSGTALSYKLVGFENVASGIVSNFTKAIQRRIELICNILNIKASEAMWRDIEIQFVRNLPKNEVETMQVVQGLQGIVSSETLLGMLDFIRDPAAELERVNKERQANMELYSFDMHEDEEVDV